ncbi:MAG TPA: glycosyltransferase [Verrucomicrobiae bacterium]|nr:glycosyltransferase [Verrucomicrobiae bacterium]
MRRHAGLESERNGTNGSTLLTKQFGRARNGFLADETAPLLRNSSRFFANGNGNGNGNGNRNGNGNGHGEFNGLHLSQNTSRRLKLVVFGLSITSSWGNGHATTYRGLLREFAARGHDVLFLERDEEWYASNRDLPEPRYCRVALYDTFTELKGRFASEVKSADLVIVGSYVREGAKIGEWVTRIATGAAAFYDIDTPVTMENLERGDLDYLTRALVPKYDMYLSFTGGPMLDFIERHYGSPMARPLYCSVDTCLYFSEAREMKWDLGYMGTYSDDRQPALDELLLEPARRWDEGRFTVVGPQYPRSLRWPRNVRRSTHLAPARHRAFYNSQRFTLNVTRASMVEAGYSPSVRLFEAAACGTPIISDFWPGLDSFFKPLDEILISNSAEETLRYLLRISEDERKQIGAAARRRVLAEHTARRRALQLEEYAFDVLKPAAA